jgi:hypothetical protein
MVKDLDIARWRLRCQHLVSPHAVSAREVLRTHVLRPTWHFVRAEDICWLLT